MASISKSQPVSASAKKRDFYWYLPPCEKCGQRHPPPPHPASENCGKIAQRKREAEARKREEERKALSQRDQREEEPDKPDPVSTAPWPEHYASWPEQIQRVYWLKRWNLLPETTSIKEVNHRLKSGKFPRPYWVRNLHRAKWINGHYTIVEETKHPVSEQLSLARSAAGKKGQPAIWRRRLRVHQAVELGCPDGVDFNGLRFRLICHWRVENLIWNGKRPSAFERLSEPARIDLIRLARLSNITSWELHVADMSAYTPEEKGRASMLVANWKDSTVAYHMGISLKRYRELDRMVNPKPERPPTHKSKVIERRKMLGTVIREQERKRASTSLASLQRQMRGKGYPIKSRETIRKDLQFIA